MEKIKSTLDAIQTAEAAPKDWTPEQWEVIHAFTAPYWGRSSKHWDDDTRETFQRLFILYFARDNVRRRAIAYAVIVAGIQTADIGALQIEVIKTYPCVGYMFMYSDDPRDPDNDRIDYTFRVTLNGKELCCNSPLFHQTLREYLFAGGLARLKPGPLFYQQRRPVGETDKPLPAVSRQSVGRLLTEASTAMGWHGKGQKIQWHTLAAPRDVAYTVK